MASEIRVNKINSQTGVGTITLSPTGVDISGITTVSTLKVGTGVTASEDGDIFFTGVCTATTFAGAHSGSGANLTNLPAANLSGTLPALSAANLTNIPAANVTGTLPAISAANLTNIPAANVTGTLPAISAANLTNIPAANIVGVCTAGLANASGVLAGITMVDSWRITTEFSFDSAAYAVTANWERSNETALYGVLGSAMTESSGIFTFPQTGIYLISWNVTQRSTSAARYNGAGIVASTNNFSSSEYISRSYDSNHGHSSYSYAHIKAEAIFDCTNTSTHKVRMDVMNNTESQVYGDTDENRTAVTFIRLGDT